MKELNREDCERIYGCGINIAPALRDWENSVRILPMGQKGDSLADALGLFEPPENPHQNTHQIRAIIEYGC